VLVLLTAAAGARVVSADFFLPSTFSACLLILFCILGIATFGIGAWAVTEQPAAVPELAAYDFQIKYVINHVVFYSGHHFIKSS